MPTSDISLNIYLAYNRRTTMPTSDIRLYIYLAYNRCTTMSTSDISLTSIWHTTGIPRCPPLTQVLHLFGIQQVYHDAHLWHQLYIDLAYNRYTTMPTSDINCTSIWHTTGVQWCPPLTTVWHLFGITQVYHDVRVEPKGEYLFDIHGLHYVQVHNIYVYIILRYAL